MTKIKLKVVPKVIDNAIEKLEKADFREYDDKLYESLVNWVNDYLKPALELLLNSKVKVSSNNETGQIMISSDSRGVYDSVYTLAGGLLREGKIVMPTEVYSYEGSVDKMADSVSNWMVDNQINGRIVQDSDSMTVFVESSVIDSLKSDILSISDRVQDEYDPILDLGNESEESSVFDFDEFVNEIIIPAAKSKFNNDTNLNIVLKDGRIIIETDFNNKPEAEENLEENSEENLEEEYNDFVEEVKDSLVNKKVKDSISNVIYFKGKLYKGAFLEAEIKF